MKSEKDVWDKIQVVSSLVVSLGIPIAVVLIGSQYTANQAEQTNRIKYVELAVGILRSQPTPGHDPLRDWAVEVIKKHATVPIPKDAQEQLLIRAAPIEDWGNGCWTDCATTESKQSRKSK